MWADAGDLLVGDMAFGSSFDKDRYIQDAANEMLSRIGIVYELPLPPLTPHLENVFRLIQARLATGRLIMAMAVGAEQNDLHAYGRSLVQLAYDDLDRIGTVYEIPGAPRATRGENRAAGVVKAAPQDSPFDVYETWVHTAGSLGTSQIYWEP